MNREQYEKYAKKAVELLEKANIVITDKEKSEVEIADFHLNDFEKTGLALITYVNTENVCAKELMMLPGQTCPEHYHPPREKDQGKEETFRCRWGKVYLYVSGEKTEKIQAKIPEGDEAYYTVFHEVILEPGDQYTLPPQTHHWFQAGEQGCVVSEFSMTSTDESDVFTDPRIQREPVIS